MTGFDSPLSSKAATNQNQDSPWHNEAYEVAAVLATAAVAAGAIFLLKPRALVGLEELSTGLEMSGFTGGLIETGERAPSLVGKALDAAKTMTERGAASEKGLGLVGERAQAAGLAFKSEWLTAPALESTGQALGQGVTEVNPQLADGARLSVLNPKTGQSLETTVLARTLEDGKQGAILFTDDQRPVANMVYSFSKPGEPNAVDSLYGQPPAQKPFLWLDYMGVEPEFRGQGVKQALVDQLRDHSARLGFGGRVKLFAIMDDGSVSAIPWYKAGFRPVPGQVIGGDRLNRVSQLLDQVVDSKMPLSLEQGKIFDSLMMELPEK
jgi:GNAT superfamily N-acetyltransferase